ncbi:Sortilin-related receptor [Penaeus vannamei]|uniref:Sortilin-related receptor n=1 Tax=Penaeus vannamei TaxID=6689 RepID=A0A423SHY7_PENVA|nr:Sortilin-related receptor [Penaeus vannamei]
MEVAFCTSLLAFFLRLPGRLIACETRAARSVLFWNRSTAWNTADTFPPSHHTRIARRPTRARAPAAPADENGTSQNLGAHYAIRRPRESTRGEGRGQSTTDVAIMSPFKFHLALLSLVIVFCGSSSKTLVARSHPRRILPHSVPLIPSSSSFPNGSEGSLGESGGIKRRREAGRLRNSCSIGTFQCRDSGVCVLSAWVCDGEKDCDDGSDEENCPTTPQYTTSTMPSTTEEPCDEGLFRCIVCSEGEFKCPAGRCVSRERLCDGEWDCADGGDEEGCPTKICSRDQFQCVTSGTCVPGDFRCDGDWDCSDGSDEEGCSVPFLRLTRQLLQMACDAHEVRCRSGNVCIPNLWVCDGEEDCGDGSDEEGCGVASSPTTPPTTPSTSTASPCDSDQVRCRLGGCILSLWRCDGERDCFDGSDEEDCDSLQCGQNEFRCASDSRHTCIRDTFMPKGYSCLCPSGHRMLLDEDECVPTDDEHVHDMLSKFPVQTLD